jgi:Zn-dependent peptidase ImmA (M78 family)
LATRVENGPEIVLYNDGHPETRIRATLMEEFFHIRLDHPRSTVRLFGSDKDGSRTFDSTVEEEAYASGAAALLPYTALRDMLGDDVPVDTIAESFNVSPKLVTFRIAVTRLSRKGKRARARRS